MLAATDISAPLQLPVWRSVIASAAAVAIVSGYFFWKWLVKHLALQRQKHLATQAKPNAAAIIQDAVGKIETIRQAITNQQISPKDAAEQLSALVRETFDATMNHTTRFQTKYEITQRRLDHLVQILDVSYPVEFSEQPSVQATLLGLCDKSRQVVEACR